MHIARILGVAALATLLWTAPALAGQVSLQTSDGVTLSAQETGDGDYGVVLVHKKGRSASDWDTFTPTLVDAGFRVLAVDLRGHGASKTDGSPSSEDYPKMVEDVRAAVAWLRDNGASKVAIVGSELGANLAVNAAAQDPEVTNLVLLSAGMNLQGVTVGGALEKYGDRPLLVVASEEEAYYHKTALALKAKATGDTHYQQLQGAGSGVRMLTRDPDLPRILVSWLDGTFHDEQDAANIGTRKVDASDTTTIETTGTAFGEDK